MVRNTKSYAPKCFDSVLKIFADLSVLKPHRTSVGRRESTCVFKMRRSCSNQETRAQYAAPRPLLQRLSLTLCTRILRFTDISVTVAGRSNPWLCFARHHFHQRRKSDIRAVMSNEDGWRKDAFQKAWSHPTRITELRCGQY